MIIVYFLEYICDIFDWKIEERSVFVFRECYLLFLCGLKMESEKDLELKFKDVVMDMF